MKLLRGPQTVDLLISNFVYEKQGATRKKIMQYRKCLTTGQNIWMGRSETYAEGQISSDAFHDLSYKITS